VIGEGGNLGLTQKARIEFALNGGRIFTDAIDNSAGVDCSDHEVNIKILLAGLIRRGDMTGKQRDALLASMTDEVASPGAGRQLSADAGDCARSGAGCRADRGARHV
jgi:glutamate dehydrogenase